MHLNGHQMHGDQMRPLPRIYNNFPSNRFPTSNFMPQSRKVMNATPFIRPMFPNTINRYPPPYQKDSAGPNLAFPPQARNDEGFVPGVPNNLIKIVCGSTIYAKEAVGNARKDANTTSSIAIDEASLVVRQKTPMCLVNELARYNKLTHQYRLTGESGPAHKKKFTVTLKLGEEEYTSEGPSIKKAQHTAAQDAMQKTKYSHPPPRINKIQKTHNKKNPSNITPTVELNAFAMKQGLTVDYMQVPSDETYPQKNGTDGIDTSDLSSNLPPILTSSDDFSVKSEGSKKYVHDVPLHKVSLKVGYRTFIGVGNTPQAARHNAASRALEVLKSASPEVEENHLAKSPESILANTLKSPISLVHEIALKRKLTVLFEVKQEKGPPHMKIFVTMCKVGDTITEGEGNGKKISRKRAAESMLEELKRLTPIAISSNVENSPMKSKKKISTVKRKNRNLVRENTSEEASEDQNPISYLIQLSQARKEKEPVYTLIEERGAPRRREFVIQADYVGVSATGNGSNKKIAKRNAASNLLVKMGIESYKEPAEVQKKTKEEPKIRAEPPKTVKVELEEKENITENYPVEPAKISVPEPAPQPSVSQTTNINPKQQLMYLSQILNFKVEFSDFPKGNHGECLTLVTLSTYPPQLCHGAGSTVEESNDQAASKALSLLRELGLDIVKKPTEP